MKEHTFLIVIGTDELPPKFLRKLGKDFSDYVEYEFKKNKIFFNAVKWFVAPRHLAVKIKILMIDQSVLCIYDKKFVSKNLNFTNNFENSHKKINNINVHSKENNISKKNFYDKNVVNNKNFENLLLSIISNSLGKLMNYKMMRWGTINASFLRPVHTVTMLLDDHLISGRFFGVDTSRVLYGNRYIQDNKIIINNADEYPEILMKKGFVVADYDVRKNIICSEIKKQATKLGGVVDIRDNKFLDEIISLSEWPVILFGRFDKRFLTLPIELIVHIMQQNQKYFPVYDLIDGILLPYFIFIINTVTDNHADIISGHENIFRTRLMDAEFFLKSDNQFRLEDYVLQLDRVLFHRKLGSLRDKTNRIIKLSEWVANQICSDVKEVKRASYLCKSDLISNMVREFPEVQGIMGMYYAQRDGESKEVALAQKEHYQPKFTEDLVPINQVSCVVSISDKMDTISGIFGIKELPAGNRDPFGLKRAAIGILRIIIQQGWRLNLSNFIHESVRLYGSQLINMTVVSDIFNFMYKRLHSWYVFNGYKKDIIKAILNVQTVYILDCDIRINTISKFCQFRNEEYIKLNMIYKRISNLLVNKNILYTIESLDSVLLIAPEEKKLFISINQSKEKMEYYFLSNRYNDALEMILELSNSANNFINNVLIMDQDQQVQMNRLILLKTVKELILRVLDFSVF